MPLINGKRFPYTEEGMAQARQAQAMSEQPMPEQPMPEQGMQEQGMPEQGMSEQGMSEQQGRDLQSLISAQMRNALYDSQESIIESMRANGQQESATVLARLMVMMINSLRMSGKRVEPGVMVLAMVDVAKALGELAVQAGVMDDDPMMVEESFFAGMAKADDELQAEALGEQDRQQYAQLMQTMRQMQQGGMQ